MRSSLPVAAFAQNRRPQHVSIADISPMHVPLHVCKRGVLCPKYHGVPFRPGDAGTIVAVASAGFPPGMAVYQVRFDDGEATLYPSFYEEELERLSAARSLHFMSFSAN